MARTGRYQAILLDLRLPDLPGLAVLATLRAEGIDVPVLVLTGFGDFESARVAGTFGAAFKAKPLYVDDLEVAVHELVARSRTSVEGLDRVPDAARAQQRAEFSSIAHLLEQLQRVSKSGTSRIGPSPRIWRQFRSAITEGRHRHESTQWS
jgi:DNA-binding NtrC family response regulator